MREGDSSTLEYRDATVADIAALQVIRGAVRENRLVTLRLTEADYERALTLEGRGFVCAEAGRVLGFAVGRPGRREVWALFVDPAQEGRGIGTGLMDRLERWLFSLSAEALHLTTAPGTRAERFYLRRGWTPAGERGGEVVFRLSRAALGPRDGGC